MKIEDSPYAFQGPERLRQPGQQPPLDIMLDELDLSFLELLTSVTEKRTAQKAAPEATAGKSGESGKADVNPEPQASARPRLTLVKPAAVRAAEEQAITQVEKDMALLADELTETDIQYLKQAVIPGLPIVMGNVPFNSIFPTSEAGQISYKGFDISPKLAELIEKGYKTGRPIRVELDNQSAVVLKIRNGQVSAEFVSTDKTMAMAMQQELDELRQRVKHLPVGTLDSKYQDSRQSRRDSEQEPDNRQ